MLTLSDVLPAIATHVIIDYYVPLSVEWGHHRPLDTLRYWRAGDLVNSLIEIGIEERTGILRRTVLVMPGSARWSSVSPFAEAAEVDGLPVVTGLPSTGVGPFDEPEPLEVIAHGAGMTIILGLGAQVQRLIWSGDAGIGVADDGTIRALVVRGLNDGLQAELHASLRLKVQRQ